MLLQYLVICSMQHLNSPPYIRSAENWKSFMQIKDLEVHQLVVKYIVGGSEEQDWDLCNA